MSKDRICVICVPCHASLTIHPGLSEDMIDVHTPAVKCRVSFVLSNAILTQFVCFALHPSPSVCYIRADHFSVLQCH